MTVGIIAWINAFPHQFTFFMAEFREYADCIERTAVEVRYQIINSQSANAGLAARS